MDLLPRRRPRRTRLRVVALVVALLAVLLASGGHPLRWLIGLPSQAVGAFQADYTFLNTTDGTDDGTVPVAWNNCRAIHYVINPQGAPQGWEPLVRSGLDELTAASGYVFVYDGTTTDRDFAAGRWKGNPVLVMWGVRRETLGLGEGVLGRGGPIAYDTGTGPEYGSGHIIFDSLSFDGLEREGDTGREQMIVEHEWMHVLGLGHVDDAHQVMARSGRYDGDYHLGKGDVAGLRALRAVPCPGTPVT